MSERTHRAYAASFAEHLTQQSVDDQSNSLRHVLNRGDVQKVLGTLEDKDRTASDGIVRSLAETLEEFGGKERKKRGIEVLLLSLVQAAAFTRSPEPLPTPELGQRARALGIRVDWFKKHALDLKRFLEPGNIEDLRRPRQGRAQFKGNEVFMAKLTVRACVYVG